MIDYWKSIKHNFPDLYLNKKQIIMGKKFKAVSQNMIISTSWPNQDIVLPISYQTEDMSIKLIRMCIHTFLRQILDTDFAIP